jgi:cell division protein FtsB
MMRLVSRSLAWLLPLSLLLGSIVGVPLLVLDPRGLPRYRALRSELRDVRAQNEQMRSEVRRLRAEVHELRSDERAVERIARDELGMVRSGEWIFQFAE